MRVSKAVKKSRILKILFVIFISSIAQEIKAQVSVSENSIPYGLGDGDVFFIAGRVKRYVFGEYSIPRKGIIYPGMTLDELAIGMREFKYTTFGGGLNTRTPLFYMLFNKNKSRLRIADDIGLGLFIGSNNLKINDDLTGEDLEFDKNKSSKPSVNVGINLHLGLQATYRLSNLLDIGFRFTPFFGKDYGNGNGSVNASGKTYSITSRIERFYLEFQTTRFGKKNKFRDGYEHNGFKTISVKYLLPKDFTFRNNGYVFMSYNSMSFRPKDTYGYGEDSSNVPAGYENYEIKKGHIRVLKIGIGLLLL
ncbi:MAG: hypothetical protein Q8K70_03205 [Bacteroidota bacterium]|nr:hypothetical protein [Bacteroidota bacterium]